jgi:glycosyltransferase involved in cell wall biosynthesis
LRQRGQHVRSELNQVAIYRIQQREINEKTKFDYLIRLCFFLINSCLFITWRHLRKPYDLIHVHSVPDFEVFAALFAKLMGAKVILDIHDIVPEFYASKFHAGKNSAVSKVLQVIEWLCCSFSNHVIISNHIWHKRIIARSVKKEKCSVILNYPDPYIFSRTKQKKESDKFIIMYPGTIAWHQGIDIAVNAMSIISEKNPNIEFHIYGKGPEEVNIARLISESGLADFVKLKGLLPLDDIVNKMMDADLGIVPKRGDDFGGEAFSTKILEFMAIGVPVLIARTIIDEYYFNDNLVTYFKCGDEKDLAEKTLYLASNPAILKQQSVRGLEYASQNNWDVKKQEYLDIVEKLLSRSFNSR